MTVWKNDFIPKNKYSRPGILLKGVEKVVLHWTGNKGATDENHHDYLEHQDDRYASAHIFVDKDSATCIIPLNEVSYHANDVYKRNKDGSPYRGVPSISPNANYYSISVEMCVEKDGTIHPETIKRTISVVADLCKIYKLTEKDIVRHYDVTLKPCPKPFVDVPKKFEDFKEKVATILKSPVYPGKIIKKGDKGGFVRLIQEALGIKVDGDFGVITDRELRNFQKENGLEADGKVGLKTWSKLF